MAQVQKVSWRTVGYAALGTAAIIAGTVGIARSDGVRPTALKSNASTRWLVDQVNHRLVLADGLTGRVLARIKTESESSEQVAAQGAGGAFLASPEDGTVRTISTAKLQLGAPQRVDALSDQVDPAAVEFGVGVNGLTVVNASTGEASLVSADDTPRPITVPTADDPYVARDGSMWLFTGSRATHVMVDGSSRNFEVRGNRSQTATVGTHAVYLDRRAAVVHWLDGGDVPVGSIPNVADAILQVQRGDDAPCVWLAASESMACVGKTRIDKTLPVPRLTINPNDQLAVADTVAVIIRAGTNQVDRVDLETGRFVTGGDPDPIEGHDLRTVSINKLVWIDDVDGTDAWVVHSLGFEHIDKADESAKLFNAQGQVEQEGTGDSGQSPSGGGAQGQADPRDHLDHNGREDKPVAVDDSVTARAGNTVIVPVTANDYDPDGQAIALLSVGDGQQAGHGSTDVLNGTSVVYAPDQGYSGTDSFEYTIVDEMGNTDVGRVTVELFPPDSPNRPPITQRDTARTRVGHAVTIDVLANDIDPERDPLTIFTFAQTDRGTITETLGPSGLTALKYTPPSGATGVFTFTYQAADTEGGVSDETEVAVEVLSADAPNEEPFAGPDAIRLRVGSTSDLNVLANDFDPDGDDLTIVAVESEPRGVTAQLVGQQLRISMHASADDSSVVRYTLSDGDPSHDVTGRVLVLKIADDTPNRAPVANTDYDRVVIGNSVDVPVLFNDIDPESDRIRLLTAEDPAGGVGTAEVAGDFVRFTPNLPDIEEPTPVTFTYRIGDGHGNTAVGRVTITVLAAPLPRNPTAVNDPAETVVGKPITIDVLRNDSDPNGGKPHLLGEPVCPNGGTAVTTPDERITFTPPVDEVDGGVYRCLYKVLGSQGQAEAWIIVTVKPVTLGNHDPEINPAATAQTIQVGSSFTFNANVVAHDPDDDPLVFSSVSKPSLGSTNFAGSSNSFTYVASTSATSELPATVSLDVQISDNRGGDVTTQISIRVVAIPTAPSTAPSTRTIPRPAEVDSSITVDVIGDLRLMPANQGIELSLVGAKADTAGQADVTPNLGAGTVTIVPHVTGNVSVSYTVQNRDQKSANGTIILSVTAKPVVNAAPVAGDDSLTVPSGGSGSVDLLRNDTGITEPGDQAVATLLFPPPASFGVVRVSNGMLTLTANPDYPGGSFQASYNLGDGTGRSDTGAVLLTIEACTVSPPAAQSATAFTPYMTPINIDLNTLVTSGNIVNSSIRGAGLTGPTGTYTPPAGKNDSEVVTFDVVNACNQVAHGTLTIDVNRAPTAHSTSLNVSPGQVQTLLPANIADDDEPLSITALQGQPDWVTRAADGSSITAAPPAGTPSNSYTFTATVADTGGLSTTATITVTVNNTAPTAVDDAYTTADTVLTLSPTANDFDAEPGPLAIQTVSLRDGPGQVVGYTDTTVTVNVGHGVSHFSYTIRDSGGLTATATITITANRPPTASDVSGTTNQSTVLIDFSASDPDGDKIDIACSPPPGWQIEILANPSPPPTVWLYVTIPPDAPRPSLQQFVCVVTDRPYGAQATATVTLRIV